MKKLLLTFLLVIGICSYSKAENLSYIDESFGDNILNNNVSTQFTPGFATLSYNTGTVTSKSTGITYSYTNAMLNQFRSKWFLQIKSGGNITITLPENCVGINLKVGQNSDNTPGSPTYAVTLGSVNKGNIKFEINSELIGSYAFDKVSKDTKLVLKANAASYIAKIQYIIDNSQEAPTYDALEDIQASYTYNGVSTSFTDDVLEGIKVGTVFNFSATNATSITVKDSGDKTVSGIDNVKWTATEENEAEELTVEAVGVDANGTTAKKTFSVMFDIVAEEEQPDQPVTPPSETGEAMFNFDDPTSLTPSYADFGTEHVVTDVIFTSGPISIVGTAPNDASNKPRLYKSSNTWSYRFYDKNTITISANENYAITKIEFTATNLANQSIVFSDNGSFGDNVWTATDKVNGVSSMTIKKTATGNNPTISKMTVHYISKEITSPELGKIEYTVTGDKKIEDGAITIELGDSFTFWAQNATYIYLMASDNNGFEDWVENEEGNSLEWTPSEIGEGIEVTVDAYDEEGSEEELTFTLTVVEKPQVKFDGGWVNVSSVDHLNIGDRIIIVNEEYKVAMANTFNTDDSNITRVDGMEFEETEHGKIALIPSGSEDNVAYITLGNNSEGNWSLQPEVFNYKSANKDAVSFGYLGAPVYNGTGSNNKITVTENPTYWSMSMDKNGVLELKSLVETKGSTYMRMNPNTTSGQSAPLFACYSSNSTQKAVQIYKEYVSTEEPETVKAPVYKHSVNYLNDGVVKVVAHAKHDLYYHAYIYEYSEKETLRTFANEDAAIYKKADESIEYTDNLSERTYLLNVDNLLDIAGGEPDSKDNKILIVNSYAKHSQNEVASPVSTLGISLYNGGLTGVESIVADGEGKVEFYNLQGVRMNEPLAPGLYIRRQGAEASKVYVK